MRWPWPLSSEPEPGSEKWERVATRHGFSLYVAAPDRSSAALRQHGELEPATTQLVETLLQPGDHFVDGGANIGYFTVLAARRVGSAGVVSSFEPSPTLRSQLAANIRLNRLRTARLFPYALADRTGAASFYEGPSEHSGVSSLRPLANSPRVTDVPLRSLDATYGDAPVRLVKLDLEGAELLAIKGMHRILTRAQPGLIMEVTDSFLRQLGGSAAELFQRLFDYGYQAWHYGQKHLRRIWRPEDAPLSQCNVLFTHPRLYDVDFLLNGGYHIARSDDSTSANVRPVRRVLFFSLHGDAAVEISELCRNASVELDIAGDTNHLVRAKTNAAERERLVRRGARAPSGEEIERGLRQRRYDAVIVGTEDQIEQFTARVRPLDPDVPMIVRHGNNGFAAWQRLGVRNIMSPSPRALERMAGCNQLLSRKLLPWDELPPPGTDPAERSGWASYIHELPRYWPDAWNRLDTLNRLLTPDHVVAYGRGSPGGEVPDLLAMRHSRATVHLKDRGICCFAVARSLAMGTPVVTDAATCERCFLDGVSSLFVGGNASDMAEELRRLADDDDYWRARSEASRAAARRHFACDADLAVRFLAFLDRAARLH
ncbi:MAG: FkbM family methyltransferase [Pirellulaceae bacterium]